MDKDAVRTLVGQGLSAMKAGSKVAASATSEIGKDLRHPDLKSALDKGNQVSQQWAQRIDQALGEVGSGGEQQNPILEAHYEVSRKIRQQAPDDSSRDLGIIADGQLALHYWIAAFGTIRTYAGQLGMSQTEQSMQASLDEAKQADEQHTPIAKRILSA